jgi:hypothetical protein
MDASDVTRKRMQVTDYFGYQGVESKLQPTVPFSTPTTFIKSNVIRNFNTYEDYNNVFKGLVTYVSSTTMGQ